ncbi:hypothetical protein BH11GEM2_BH11GEM2_06990 [soil metagenome]
MTCIRKKLTAVEKMVLLRSHLCDKVPVSTVCTHMILDADIVAVSPSTT